MNDRFLAMFFEEARELLQALESGLMEMESKADDRAHLDRTFRAAHTLKGAAGMVGLRPLADFTHKMEAVLDRFRSGTMTVQPEAITILLRGRDHLEAALNAVADGGTAPEAPADLIQDLDDLGEGKIKASPAAAPAPAPDDSAGPEPVLAAATAPAIIAAAPVPPPSRRAEPVERPLRSYRIELAPGPELFQQGVNPLGFLDELRDLGEAKVTFHPDLIPPLAKLDPESCALAWSVELTTNASRAQLDDVFLLLGDPGQVTITELAPKPASSSATPPPVAPSGLVPAAAEPATVAPAPAVATPASGAAPAAAAAPVAKANRIRVDAEQLDQLVGMAGELAVLTDSLQGLAELPGAERWSGMLEALERLGRRLRDTTLELRMVPIEELFVRFPRVVRDLADRVGKKIDLKLEGQDTQLDRTIIERLVEPMIHLIRNAIDHGLETPDERLAAGKGPTGRITIGAGHEGDRVAIRISDDGRGLDRAKILKKGIKLGLLPPETPIDDPRVANLIFEAGFSTRDQAGELSGRGVGMDVVSDTIRSLRGTITLRSQEGRGTTFLIRLPLTLAMIDGLLVEVDGDRYVVPIGQVDECVSLSPEEAVSTMGRLAAVVRGELVPILALRGLFGADGAAPDGRRRELLLTRFGEQRVGVVVDQLLGRVQAVIQPLDAHLARLNRFSGATILGDGSVSLILDLAGLVNDARSTLSHSPSAAAGRVAVPTDFPTPAAAARPLP